KVRVLYQRHDQNATEADGIATLPARISKRNRAELMEYVSTRGEAPALGFSDALLSGLARDGGLYVPREWPHFSESEIRALRGRSYQEIAFAVLRPFLGGEIDDATFRRIIDEA